MSFGGEIVMEESGLKLLLWEVFLPTQKSAPLLHAKRGGTVAVLSPYSIVNPPKPPRLSIATSVALYALIPGRG